MRIALIALAGAVTFAGVAAQEPIPREQPLIIKSTVGSELYKFYCADCHGLDARGRAPAVAGRKAAPGLTQLSAQHGGVFPREEVAAVIAHGSGRLTAHGSPDMPVWGGIFRALDPNDVRVQVRIDNLVEYLESVQDSEVGRGSR